MSQKLNKSAASEKLLIKPLYTSEDLKGIKFLDSLPGVELFVRGPYASMYSNKPWTIRQYAGFSTPEESNLFFKQTLANGGQAGLPSLLVKRDFLGLISKIIPDPK